MYIRVRTTLRGIAPAFAIAVKIISRQRPAWTAGSGSHSPSGQIGAVPDTKIRLLTRTARLNPIVFS